MNHPRIALLTGNQKLAAGLCDSLADECDVLRCDWPFDRFPSGIEKLRPGGLIVDFTTVSSGGHAEDRALDDVQQIHPQLPVVMLTGDDCPEPLARRAACTDLIHLRGPLAFEQIIGAVRELLSIDSAADARPMHAAAAGVCSGLRQQFDTNTPSLTWMLQELEVAASHDVTILLIGETGVGKTFLARQIHNVSPRSGEPFMTVACGALPGDLIESELFGHVKGAFTSAYADKQGKFVAAAGGTMLLDEIDALEPEQQVKLLRVIETGEFEPVGSTTTIQGRARLIVASNLELQPLVEQRRFRPDLYYRLNMLKFEIPPLRERPADVKPLAEKFIGQLSRKYGVAIEGVEDSLFSALEAYPWPGNVRELENVLRRAVIYCDGDSLNAAHLPPNVRNGRPGPSNDAHLPQRVDGASIPLPAKQTLGGQIERTECEIIRHALVNNNHIRTKTARELGISRVTLYNKMRKYGIE